MDKHLDPDDTKIYIGFGLYSASTASHEFEQIAKFLRKNPSEIVIIDLNGDWLHTVDAHNKECAQCFSDHGYQPHLRRRPNSDRQPDYDFYIKLDSLLDYRFLRVFVFSYFFKIR